MFWKYKNFVIQSNRIGCIYLRNSYCYVNYKYIMRVKYFDPFSDITKYNYKNVYIPMIDRYTTEDVIFKFKTIDEARKEAYDIICKTPEVQVVNNMKKGGRWDKIIKWMKDR
jgi:hypothetical protein